MPGRLAHDSRRRPTGSARSRGYETLMNRIALLAAATMAMTLPAAALDQARFERIAADVFAPVMAEYDIPGLAVGVVIEGETHVFTAGVANRKTKAPVTADTLFELGSVSKLFTVTLAARAEGDGALALEDLHHDGAARHERHEVAEEGALAVDAVEGLGLLCRHADAPLGNEAQSLLLEHGVDRAGEVAARGVGLDDREGALGGHVVGRPQGSGSGAPLAEAAPRRNPAARLSGTAPAARATRRARR